MILQQQSHQEEAKHDDSLAHVPWLRRGTKWRVKYGGTAPCWWLMSQQEKTTAHQEHLKVVQIGGGCGGDDTSTEELQSQSRNNTP